MAHVRLRRMSATVREVTVRALLRKAYADRADINRRISELVEELKAISPDYRKTVEQIEG